MPQTQVAMKNWNTYKYPQLQFENLSYPGGGPDFAKISEF